MECVFGNRTKAYKEGLKFIVDPDDYEKYVKKNSFQMNDNGYVRFGKGIKLHRVIMNVNDPKTDVDHINGNKLDNRKSNLRLCNRSQNCMNRGKPSNNSSGFKGVSFDKQKQKYHAYIKLNYKREHIGYFDTAEEAHQAYCKRASELHKDFANFGQ